MGGTSSSQRNMTDSYKILDGNRTQRKLLGSPRRTHSRAGMCCQTAQESTGLMIFLKVKYQSKRAVPFEISRNMVSVMSITGSNIRKTVSDIDVYVDRVKCF
jgi:hypothetical protein